MDNDPGDDDSTVEFPPVGGGTVAFPELGDDGGPACGTELAATYFLATFTDDSGVRFAERHCCCFRHIPRPADVLPAGAELVEIVIEDAVAKTVVRNGQAEVTLSGSETITIPAVLQS
jgi:hypothetical protein